MYDECFWISFRDCFFDIHSVVWLDGVVGEGGVGGEGGRVGKGRGEKREWLRGRPEEGVGCERVETKR